MLWGSCIKGQIVPPTPGARGVYPEAIVFKCYNAIAS